MDKKKWYITVQLLIVLLLAGGVLLLASFLSNRNPVDAMENIRVQALLSISQGNRVLRSQEIEHSTVRRAHFVAGGDVVYELSSTVFFSEVQVLVRLNAAGVFQEYRIMALINRLQGWEFGNSFAHYELASSENGTDKNRTWKREILNLIEVAKRYHP